MASEDANNSKFFLCGFLFYYFLLFFIFNLAYLYLRPNVLCSKHGKYADEINMKNMLICKFKVLFSWMNYLNTFLQLLISTFIRIKTQGVLNNMMKMTEHSILHFAVKFKNRLNMTTAAFCITFKQQLKWPSNSNQYFKYTNDI